MGLPRSRWSTRGGYNAGIDIVGSGTRKGQTGDWIEVTTTVHPHRPAPCGRSNAGRAAAPQGDVVWYVHRCPCHGGASTLAPEGTDPPTCPSGTLPPRPFPAHFR